MKATEQYFSCGVFIILCKLVLSFKSAQLAVYSATQGGYTGSIKIKE